MLLLFAQPHADDSARPANWIPVEVLLRHVPLRAEVHVPSLQERNGPHGP